MQYTTNYNMQLPEDDDQLDVYVLDDNFEFIDEELANRAEKEHASATGEYGAGTAEYYGHVKLSDSVEENYTAEDGVAATPSAVKSAYDAAVAAQQEAETRAAKNHRSSTSDYGMGTETYYGHVKLSDSVTDSSHTSTGGVAATPYAVKLAYDAAEAAQSTAEAKADNVEATADSAGLMSAEDKATLDGMGYTIKKIYAQTEEISAGLYYVDKEAAAYFPVSGHGYIVSVFDEYNVGDSGNSTWKLNAIDLDTGYCYAGTSSIDSSENDVFNNSISWGNANMLDAALSSTSTNAVQNKVIYTALQNKAGTSVATATANGLMSADDKTLVNGMTTYNSTVQIGSWGSAAVYRVSGVAEVSGLTDLYEDYDIANINSSNATAILRQMYYYDVTVYNSYVELYAHGVNGTVYYVVEYVALEG